MWISIAEKVLQFVRWLFAPENIWALVLCLITLVVVIFTADAEPLWIYQGF